MSYGYDLTSAITVDTKYEQAVKTASQALYKQIGLEASINKVKDASQSKVNTWTKLNNLDTVFSVGGSAISILVSKKIELHSGNFVLTGTSDKKGITWIKGF